MELKDEGDKDQKSYLIKSSLVFSISQIFVFLIGIVSIWVSGNYINSYSMGIISIFSTFYTMASLITLNLPDGLVRYLSLFLGEKNEQKVQEVINLNYVLFFVTLIATVIIIPIIIVTVSNFLNIQFDYTQLSILIMSVILFQCYSFLRIILTSFKHYNKIAIISLISNSAGMVISIIMMILGFDVTGFIIRWLILNLTGVAIIAILIIKLKLPFRKKTKKLFSIVKILNFSLPSFINTVFLIIILNFYVKVTIGAIFGLDVLGYYEFALKIIAIVTGIMLGFSQITQIHYSHEFGKGGKEKIKENLNWSLRLTTFILIPLIFFMIIFGYPIFLYFLPKYIPSIPYLYGILVFNILPYIYVPFISFLYAYGKNWYISLAYIIGYSPLIFIFLFFLPQLGIFGIILGSDIFYFVFTILILVFSNKFISIKNLVLIPVKFTLISSPILITGLLLVTFLNQIYFIPFILFIFLVGFLLLIRYGNLINENDIDRGFSFLPEKIINLIKKIFLKKQK